MILMAKLTENAKDGSTSLTIPRFTSSQLRSSLALFVSFYKYHVKVILQRVDGYHFGVLCCAWTSGIVLLLNVVVTIWAGRSFGTRDGIGTLQEGSCKRSSNLSFWIHLIINILSTALLGATNYSMQCLASPTRADVDKAHARGFSLDFGVPSLGNLRYIGRHRMVLWWLLAVSTVPLHLLWNSAVFTSLCTRNYCVRIVPTDFPQSYTFQWRSKLNENGTRHSYSTFDVDFTVNITSPETISDLLVWNPYSGQNWSDYYLSSRSSFQRLTPNQCLSSYVGPIISTRADVFLVSSKDSTLVIDSENSEPAMHYSVDFSNYDVDASKWMHHNADLYNLTKRDLLKTASHKSTVFTMWDVQYCWSQQQDEHCKLQYSLLIMIIVMICNATKFSCMAWIAWKENNEPLITLGDALASFLKYPDTTVSRQSSTGMDKSRLQFPRNRFRFKKHSETRSKSGSLDPCSPYRPSEWHPVSRYWFSSARMHVWDFYLGL